jgi:DNA repair protein RecO (recombination protein O)
MPERETEAIILRCYPLGEADRLVSFLGRTTGRLRGVATGARRPKSRFGSTLEPLSHIRMWFYERETRELVRIQQCELIQSFLEVQRDYNLSLGLAAVSEIAEGLLPEREPAEAAFRLVLVTAREIGRHARIALPLAYFNLWMMRLGGWLPQLDRCAGCGRGLGAEAAYASPFFSGLACANCRTAGMRGMSGPGLALARRMLAEKLERLAEEEWPASQVGELNGYLFDLVEHHLERKLTTRRLIDSQMEAKS